MLFAKWFLSVGAGVGGLDAVMKRAMFFLLSSFMDSYAAFS
jgi:hypothetical protein